MFNIWLNWEFLCFRITNPKLELQQLICFDSWLIDWLVCVSQGSKFSVSCFLKVQFVINLLCFCLIPNSKKKQDTKNLLSYKLDHLMWILSVCFVVFFTSLWEETESLCCGENETSLDVMRTFIIFFSAISWTKQLHKLKNISRVSSLNENNR